MLSDVELFVLVGRTVKVVLWQIHEKEKPTEAWNASVGCGRYVAFMYSGWPEKPEFGHFSLLISCAGEMIYLWFPANLSRQ